MASMNLLGFSLSSSQQEHEHPSQSQPHTQQDHCQTRFGFNSDGISADSCFDLTSHDSAVVAHSSLNNLPPPFGIFEATFNRNTTTIHPNTTQDWNLKGLGSNLEENYNNSQQNLLLMGTSCSSASNQNQQQEPKLENFLGRHSFSDHEQATTYTSRENYMFPNRSLQLLSHPAVETSAAGEGGATAGCISSSSSSIGLSMIKTWLRNQPLHNSDNNNNNNNSETSGSAGTITHATAPAGGTLSLSMSTGSQSSFTANAVGGGGESSSISDGNGKQPPTTTLDTQAGSATESSTVQQQRKSIDTFGQRTSIYRGVTRHRWTGRYEAHLWDNSCRREGQTRKGRQVYLGGYDKEEKAARAYDLAALKYWGATTTTNFPISHYEKELEEMKHMTRQEYVASLRRKSSGFSRGASIYRGVTRHHQHGRWQARIGRVAGNKDLYLGTFSTQEEAAEAYDVAAIKFRGLNAVTNFDMSRYDVKSILESPTLPIGAASNSKRFKDIELTSLDVDHSHSQTTQQDTNSTMSSITSQLTHQYDFGAFHQPQPQPMHYHYPSYGQGQISQRLMWCKQEQDSDACQDFHQLQLAANNNTHNFFHSNNNFIAMDSAAASSMDNNNNHSSGGNSGSNSVIYGDGSGGAGYVIPMAMVTATTATTVIANNDHGNQNQRISNNGFGYESVFGSTNDPYDHARNLYYLSQQSSSTDQGSSPCNTTWVNTTWVPSAIPTHLAPRPGTNMALCPGVTPFNLLHE